MRVKKTMNFFFNPKSIALIGASKRPWGSYLLENVLKGYRGTIYPINPNYDKLGGLTCYPSVEEVPGAVDLAIIVIPAASVPDVLKACARKRVRGVIIESGGFAEIGEEGKILQEECVAIARESGMRLWGPNCLGLVDVPGKKFFTFTFPRIFRSELLSGKISMVVQSGALTGVFLPELMNRNAIGLNKVCSIGNKADIDECDVLEYLFEDNQTDAIALYLESIPRGRLFLEMLNQSEKPLVVLKVGESQSGAQAAISHTASLAGDVRLTCSLLEETGVVLADDFQQMVDLTRTLAQVKHIPPKGRVAVLTPSGASSILSCDHLEQYGLDLAQLSEDTLRSLSRILPAWMPPGHPVDIGPAVEKVGSLSSAVEQAVETVCEDPNVDVILVHYFFVDGELPNLKSMKEKADHGGKVLVFWGVGFQEDVLQFRIDAQRLGVLVFNELSRATECLAAAVRFKRDNLKRPRSRRRRLSLEVSARQHEPDQQKPTKVLDEHESNRLLASWGIPVVKENLASNLSEAIGAASELGYPLVLKGLTTGTVHKSELSLVEKHINNQNELREAFTRVSGKLGGKGRIIIQPKVRIDYELIAGFIQDSQFGACVMIGLGGFFAEFEPDVVFALAPLDKEHAFKLLQRVKARRLFDGYRGLRPVDRDCMADILVKLGQMGTSLEEIRQIDINPLAVYEGRPVVLDANILTTAKGR